MNVAGYRCVSFFKNKDNEIQKRNKKWEVILLNGDVNVKRVIRILELSVARGEDLQATSENLSQEWNKEDAEIIALKERSITMRKEITQLRSANMEFKKNIVSISKDLELVLQKKIEAEAGRKDMQNELVKMHEVSLKAIAYYKNKLHVRVRLNENKQFLVQFLNISTTEHDLCTLILCRTDNKWNLLSMEPALHYEKNLTRKLETVQDIQGFISHVRKLFIQISEKEICRTEKVCKQMFH